MSHIFISYSHLDKVYVHKLQAALQNEGFDAWIDDRISYGDQWLKVIQKQLDECDAFIIVMSANSSESEMVQNEITRAREKRKQIFPVLLDGENWLIVQSKQYVDVRDESLPTEKFYQRLEAVTTRKKPTVIAPSPLPQALPVAPRQLFFKRLGAALKAGFSKALPIIKIAGWIAIAIAFLWGGAWVISQLPPQVQAPEATPTVAFTTQPFFDDVLVSETSTPRPTVVPPENILLQENFAGNGAQAWVADEWKIGKEPGGNSYWWSWTNTAVDSYAWYNDNVSSWSNYIFESQVKLFVGSSLSICVRTDEDDAYYIVTFKPNQIKSAQYSRNFDSRSRELGIRYERAFDEDVWRRVRIEIRDNFLITYVDDTLMLRDVLPEPLLRTAGGVGYIAEGKVYVDDIRIWDLK